MLAIEQLKDVVLSNFEKTGYLDNIRAQLKQQVYQIIENQQEDLKKNAGFQWSHPIADKLREMKEGVIALQLIAEFLEYFKFDFTLPVFKKEINFKDIINRDKICEELNYKSSPDFTKPILMNLIQEFQKIMENGFHQNSISYDTISNKASFKQDQVSKKDYNSDQILENVPKVQTNNFVQDKEQEKAVKNKSRQEFEEKLRREKKERDEKERKEKEEKARQEKEERERKEREEQKKEEERKEKERQERKEQEKKKIEQERANYAAKIKKETPKSAVNKIRGGITTPDQQIKNMYGIDLVGNAQSQQQQQQMMMYGNNKFNNAYGYGNMAGGMGAGGSPDPYAFDITEAAVSNNQKMTGYGGNVDPYAFDIDQDISLEDNNNKKKGWGNTTKKSGKQNPYDYDLDIDNDVPQKPGNKKPNKQDFGKKNQKKEEEIDEYVDEDIDDLGISKTSVDNKDKKNPLFTSSEDPVGASQSQGFDQSVDSDAIHQYDFYEPVKRK